MVSEPQRERYIQGHDPSVIQALSARTASSDGAFFLPYLRPGMSLLDCGCGPGSITLGLAEAVDPGLVTGIDVEGREIEHASALAKNMGVTNANFLVGNVYQLEFADNSFDAVFAHAMIQYLATPEQALQEMRRVLKPDGLVGIRANARGTFIITPSNALLDEYMGLMDRFWRYNGGDPDIGVHLKTLLHQAGFARCEATASFEYAGDPESVHTRAQREIGRLESPQFLQQAVELGWVSAATLSHMADAWHEFSSNPDSFYAVGRCEAVGWKE